MDNKNLIIFPCLPIWWPRPNIITQILHIFSVFCIMFSNTILGSLMRCGVRSIKARANRRWNIWRKTRLIRRACTRCCSGWTESSSAVVTCSVCYLNTIRAIFAVPRRTLGAFLKWKIVSRFLLFFVILLWACWLYVSRFMALEIEIHQLFVIPAQIYALSWVDVVAVSF